MQDEQMRSFARPKMSFFGPLTIFLIIIICISGIALWLFSYSDILSPKPADMVVTPQPTAKPTGEIILNLGDGTISGLFKYDVSSGLLSQLPFNLLSPNLSGNSEYLIGSSLGRDAEDNVFSAIFVRKGEELFGDIYASSSVAEVFRHAKISQSGSSYAFGVSPDSDDPDIIFTPEEWKIYAGYTSTGTPYFIDEGIYQHFIPGDNGLVYLKNDGIHVFDFVTETESLVYAMEAPTSANMMLNVSQDGRRLVFTLPSEAEVVVVDVSSWQPFEVSERHVFDLYAFWPVFSPDAHFVAVQRFDAIQKLGQHFLEPENSRLSIINIESGEISDVYDLSGYLQNEILVPEWIESGELGL